VAAVAYARTPSHHPCRRNAPYFFPAVPTPTTLVVCTCADAWGDSIDDVEDGSSLRRGFPVAHSIYGVPQTINSANYIYFCALRELETLDNPQLFKIFYGKRLVEWTDER
jgi:Polyprenyl synthetase